MNITFIIFQLPSLSLRLTQGKITKDELDKAGNIESNLDMIEDKSNSKKQTDEATQLTIILTKTKT